MGRKGDCFQVAGGLAISNGFTLVHGKVSGSGELLGETLWHAWCEVDNRVVVDYSNGQKTVIGREWYYEMGEVTTTRKYSSEEACIQSLKHGHWGPWENPAAHLRGIGPEKKKLKKVKKMLDIIVS